MAPTALSELGSGKSIVWAILLIAFGFLAIALPLAASWGVVVVIAWLIVFSGGVLYLIVGLYLLINPLLGVAAFTFALAILLLPRALWTWRPTSRIAARQGPAGFFSTESSL